MGAESWSPNQVACHLDRHAWDWDNAQWRNHERGALAERTLPCLRNCGVSKTEIIVAGTGILVKRRYYYDDKTYLANGEGRTSFDEIRRMAVRVGRARRRLRKVA